MLGSSYIFGSAFPFPKLPAELEEQTKLAADKAFIERFEKICNDPETQEEEIERWMNDELLEKADDERLCNKLMVTGSENQKINLMSRADCDPNQPLFNHRKEIFKKLAKKRQSFGNTANKVLQDTINRLKNTNSNNTAYKKMTETYTMLQTAVQIGLASAKDKHDATAAAPAVTSLSTAAAPKE